MFQDRTKIEIAHTETGRRAAAHQRRMFKHSQGFIIGRQILESGRNVFLTFADGWMLLNIIRYISSGYATQLCGDVTSKASTAALNKLGFGVNMLGA